MYHYVEDREFLKNMRWVCSNIINQLVQDINNENEMEVEAQLIGSGARKLETQNANEPIDLDYNINIVGIDYDINNCKRIKEYIRKKFNIVLSRNNWSDSKDSKSVLSTSYIRLEGNNKTKFKIDLGIVFESNNGSWYRLVHKKTGTIANDEWIWNEGPNSKNLVKKVNYIKNCNGWPKVIKTYLEKKNMYLRKNDHNHPSFICYIETINEVYKAKGGK